MDKIFIFFHITKCAGTTVNMNLNKNFDKENILYLTKGRNFFNLKTNNYEKFIDRSQIENYLNSLPGGQKDKIKVIFGHNVFYGIDKFFHKEPFYFTFMREPFSRIVSQYRQSKKTIYANDIAFDPIGKNIFSPDKKAAAKRLMRDGKIIDLETYIKGNIKPKGTLVSSLVRADFFPKRAKENFAVEDFLKELKKFSFIGTVENFEKDFNYLCRIMGIKRFYSKENASGRDGSVENLSQEKMDELREIFLNNAPADKKLYEAVTISRKLAGPEKGKIAIFHDYFRIIGGAEKLVLTLARELNADIITSEANTNCIAEAGFLNENIIPLGRLSKFSFFLPSLCKKRFEECDFSKDYSLFIFSGNFSIYAAKKHKPNVWYCHTPLRGLYDLKRQNG